MEERVNHPQHYKWLKELCGIEPQDVCRHLDFNLGNAVKYILRCGHKSEDGMTDSQKAAEDLSKAIWYLEDEINCINGAYAFQRNTGNNGSVLSQSDGIQ